MGEWGVPAIFWTALAASVLLKGPVVPAIVALTIAALCVSDRSGAWLRRLKPLPGLVWFLVLVVPFVIEAESRTAGLLQRPLDRLLQTLEGRWAPPGYFWVLFWVTFWPASALAPMATAYAWLHRREHELRFLIAWIVPGWLMFELVLTKQPHYVLPLYPGVAILIALSLERRAPVDRWTVGTSALWPIFAALFCVGVAVLAVMFEGRFGRAYWPFAALALAFGALAWWRIMGETAERGFVLALIAAMATAFAVYTVLPRTDGLAIASRLVAAAKRAPCGNPELSSAGFDEPNLIFLGGTSTLRTTGEGAAEFLRQGGCRVAFVERQEERAFADRASSIGLATARIAEVQGFDYSNWRRVSFVVLMPKEAN
jgi:4-amino-4-deoxy-L-arabinose transferase-like glycosyltransferase